MKKQNRGKYMKKYNLVVSGLLAFASVGLADDVSVKKTFVKGDVVEVKSCNKFQWCKLSDGNGYIKKFHFAQNKDNKSVLVQDKVEETYLYKKRPIFKDDKAFAEFIKRNSEGKGLKNASANYSYGYVGVQGIKNYETSLQAQKVIVAEAPEVVSSETLAVAEETPIVAKETPVVVKKVAVVVEETPVVAEETPVVVEETPKFFVFGNIGYGSFDTSHSKDQDIMLNAGLGYYLTNDYFITIAYQGNLQDDSNMLRGVDLDTYYASINKQFDVALNPYIGLIAGYSTMESYLNPSDLSAISSQNDNGFSYGAQAGISYPVYKNFSLGAKIEYVNYNLETQSLKLNSAFNLFTGISYKF